MPGLFDKFLSRPDVNAKYTALVNQVAPQNLAGKGSGDQFNFHSTGDPNRLQDLDNLAANELSRVRSGTANEFGESLTTIANRDNIEREATQARGLANEASDVAKGIFERRTRGLQLTDRQKAGAKNSFSINRAVSVADAGTNSRRGLNRDALAAMRAGGGFENIAFGQQLAALTGLANAEGQKNIRLAQERANKQSSKNSLIGTVVGAGLSLLPLASSEHIKDKVEVDPSLLEKLKDMRFDKWKYHGVDANHIGPYAEEFNEKFGVGELNDRIDLISLLGVTLGSIKELDKKVESLA